MYEIVGSRAKTIDELIDILSKLPKDYKCHDYYATYVAVDEKSRSFTIVEDECYDDMNNIIDFKSRRVI